MELVLTIYLFIYLFLFIYLPVFIHILYIYTSFSNLFLLISTYLSRPLPRADALVLFIHIYTCLTQYLAVKPQKPQKQLSQNKHTHTVIRDILLPIIHRSKDTYILSDYKWRQPGRHLVLKDT